MEGLRQRKREKDGLDSTEQERETASDDQSALPTYTAYALIFTFLLCVKIFGNINQRLPAGLKISDEDSNPDR